MSTGVLIFLGLVFAAVFLLAQGLIVPVFGESAKTRRLLQQRLRKIQAEGEHAGTEVAAAREVPQPALAARSGGSKACRSWNGSRA